MAQSRSVRDYGLCHSKCHHAQTSSKRLFWKRSRSLFERLNRHVEIFSLWCEHCQGGPFVRVDLYSIGERVIFGEMNWSPEGGLGRFSPDIYDLHLGQALTLPNPVSSSLVSQLPF